MVFINHSFTSTFTLVSFLILFFSPSYYTMQKYYYFIVYLIVFFIISCSEKKIEPGRPINAGGYTSEKTNVQTYEIINLKHEKNTLSKISATFGSASIELINTSDSTLTFFVPDVTDGEHFLEFEQVKIKFNVTKTLEVDPQDLVTKLFEKFDTQISSFNPSTLEEIAENDSIKIYKENVLKLFNSLSVEEKRQTALFYEANKAVFKAFSNSTFLDLNASTSFRIEAQSDCPRTDFKTFYGCTADNLANSAVNLKNCSREFVKIMFLAGASVYLAPASFGLSAAGTTLALGMAGYLLITEVKPAVQHFKRSLYPFLNAHWIFSKALFLSITEVFQDQFSTGLNLKPKFLSISMNDANVNLGSARFINAMSSLSTYWNRLTSVFGNFPLFKNKEGPCTLTSNDISITNISNDKVQLVSKSGETVKFKSLSGKDEAFKFNIKVIKEGFIEEKIISARVVAFDSIAHYTSLLTGKWTLNFKDSSFKQFYIFDNVAMSFLETGYIDGSGNYHISPECQSKNYTWSVFKGTPGYSVKLNRPYESRYYYALIKDKGNLEFYNAFNTCAGGCTPPAPCK